MSDEHDEIISEIQGPQAFPSVSTRSQSKLNRSAGKKYALKVSDAKRAGKFERVAESFMDSVEADLESSIRAWRAGDVDVQPDADSDWLINGRALKSVEEAANELTKRIIYRKVMKHPTVGKTLKG